MYDDYEPYEDDLEEFGRNESFEDAQAEMESEREEYDEDEDEDNEEQDIDEDSDLDDTYRDDARRQGELTPQQEADLQDDAFMDRYCREYDYDGE